MNRYFNATRLSTNAEVDAKYKKPHNFFIIKKNKKSFKENLGKQSSITEKVTKNTITTIEDQRKNIMSESLKNSKLQNNILKLPSLETKNFHFLNKSKSKEKNSLFNSFNAKRTTIITQETKKLNSSQFSISKNKNKETSKKKTSFSHKPSKKCNLSSDNKFLWQSQIANGTLKQNSTYEKKFDKNNKRSSSNAKIKKIETSNKKPLLKNLVKEFESAENTLSFKYECKQFLRKNFQEINSIYTKYKNLKEIGRGSYAIAYKVICKATNSKLVLKTFLLDSFTKKTHLNRLMVRNKKLCKNNFKDRN